MRPALDLNLLAVFRALSRHESVTRAADALNLTQSAVSHALARLRQHYDDLLFVRSGGRMRQTPRARQIAPRIEEALAVIEGTLQTVFDPRLVRRAFRVGLVAFDALYLVPALMGRLATEAPEARVLPEHLDPAEASRRLQTGAFDFALGVFDEKPPGWRSTPLFHDRLVLIAAEGNRKVGTRIGKAALGRLDHVRLPMPERFEAALSHGGFERKVVVSVDDMLSALFVVARTDFVAIVPSTVARIYREVCKLRILPLPARMPPYLVDIVYDGRMAADQEHAWFVSLVRDLAAELGNAMGTNATARPRGAGG